MFMKQLNLPNNGLIKENCLSDDMLNLWNDKPKKVIPAGDEDWVSIEINNLGYSFGET